MTITEFISEENLNRENPFEGCDVIQRIGIRDYSNMAKAAANIAFKEKTGEYRPLFREMGIRISIMCCILNLEISEDYDTDKLFEVVMCSGLYDRFYEEIALKIAPDMPSIEDGINEYLDNELNLIYSGGKNLDERVVNTLINLLNNEAFLSILEHIPVDDTEVASENDG